MDACRTDLRLDGFRKLKLAAYTADESAAVAAFDEVSHEFDRLEGLMSTWREHYEIQGLNAAAGQYQIRAETRLSHSRA